jgi:hypothetical protein
VFGLTMERGCMSIVDRKASANPVTHEQPSIVTCAASSNTESNPLAQYECGPIEFSGTDDTFYERRLIFDKVIDPSAATLRDQFEVFALSLRNVLAQRWAPAT